jgi:hypothetical protein
MRGRGHPDRVQSSARGTDPYTSQLLGRVGGLHLNSLDGILKFSDLESARAAFGEEDFRGMKTIEEEGSESIPQIYSALPQIKHLRETALNFHRDVRVDVFGLDFAVWTEGPGLDYPHLMMLQGGFDEEAVVIICLVFSTGREPTMM